ncbi:hypothetical protein A9179_04785 [Pseudomonas alcaligenes]|uniref:DUF2335 domain-containing protein n=1 Tax=Aquipseudomonas alcaligenes TaxID=43263 RepID=A0ABR7RYM6_AQUAC|nr:hypothetical protein [Pseudomonas alcaligenes]MBC9249587.1 hypothetical protein [Pseudomonas alcaligenes]
MARASEEKGIDEAGDDSSPGLSANFYGLIEFVLRDSSLSPEQKVMLIDEVRKSTPASDRWTSRYAIYSLVAIALLSMVGIIWLGLADKWVPDGLVAIGSAAVGGLAGLLVPRKG